MHQCQKEEIFEFQLGNYFCLNSYINYTPNNSKNAIIKQNSFILHVHLTANRYFAAAVLLLSFFFFATQFDFDFDFDLDLDLDFNFDLYKGVCNKKDKVLFCFKLYWLSLYKRATLCGTCKKELSDSSCSINSWSFFG